MNPSKINAIIFSNNIIYVPMQTGQTPNAFAGFDLLSVLERL